MDFKQALENIKKNITKKSGYKNQIIEIIFNLTSVNLEPSELDTKKENIYLRTSAIKRTQIMIKKAEILKEISANLKLNFLNIV